MSFRYILCVRNKDNWFIYKVNNERNDVFIHSDNSKTYGACIIVEHNRYGFKKDNHIQKTWRVNTDIVDKVLEGKIHKIKGCPEHKEINEEDIGWYKLL